MTANDKLEDGATETISPSLATGPRRFSLHVATGIFCFVLALLFYWGAVLRIDFKRTDFLDLDPYPDAVEYFAQANSILKEGAPTIQIGYDKLPSRYPPGYPILMIPWLSFLPHNGILAPFRTNQTIGAVAIDRQLHVLFCDWKAARRGIGGPVDRNSTSFITFSRSSMSDLSGGAVIVLAFALVYLGLAWRRRLLIYCAAIVLGLSLCIRPQLVFFAPLLIAMALFPANVSWTRWFMHCCLALAVFAVAASPYFILNTLEFGHPLKTGYEFWVPALADKQAAFSLHNVPPQVGMIWSEITASWDQFRVANLFGTGTYVVPAFIFLSALGLAFVRVRRFEISAFLAGIVYFMATVTYTYVEGRFYIPVFFLLVALAVLPAGMGSGPSSQEALFDLGALECWRYSCSAVSVIRHNQALSPRVVDHKPGTLFITQTAMENHSGTRRRRNLFASFKDEPGIVLSDIDPPYLNALLPKPFVAAPIDDNHDYCYSRLWHYGKAEAVQLVANGLGRATPVYALLLPSKDVDQDIKRLPVIQGYSWKRSNETDTAAVIMTLTKDASAPTLEPAFRSVEW